MQSISDMSAREARGREIYLKGDAGQGEEITAIMGELDLPASAVACAGCHGLRGEGKSEGGVKASQLTWEALTRTQTSAATGRERPGYTEATLARSIGEGVDPSGARFSPAMPRYKMTGPQMADLIAYIRKLGVTPGVTDNVIKIGAALPMTGPLSSSGQDIKAALTASFEQVNSQGGIYGRRFELVVRDSRGEPAQTLEATRRLVDQDGVFALVGSFLPDGGASISDYVSDNEVLLIGPVTLSPQISSTPNQYIYYLLPTFADQARSLVDFVKTRSGDKAAHLAVIYSDSDINRDALSGLRTQAAMYGMEIVAEHSYKASSFDAEKALGALTENGPDQIFFFGAAGDMDAFAREMERAEIDVTFLSSAIMIGRGALSLPPGVAARTFLSYPTVFPNQDDLAGFMGVMKKGGAPVRSPGFQMTAYGATKVLIEAIKLSGKQLDRLTLIEGLERIGDLRTGVVPPLTFGPNRRVGSTGSVIVKIDLDKKQLIPVTDRLVPKEKP